MALITGFQANTTIHAAFWIYKPDPTQDPVSKETIVEVNSLQYIEANAASVLANITSTQVTSNVVTVNFTIIGSATFRAYQQVILSGLTTTTALNGQILTVLSVTPSSFTASYTTTDYGPTSEAAGAIVTDCTNRMCELYYAETSVSTSQAPRKLTNAIAARFIFDMEALFS